MNKLKVMVVDDSTVYKRILTRAVEGTGMANVECSASNGVIALERLSQREIDVVLLDVFMPELDGMETLKIIRRDYPHVFAIMISGGGVDSAKNTVEALGMGAIDFIMKPMDSNPERNLESIKRQLHILFAQVSIKKHSFSSNQELIPKVDTFRKKIKAGEGMDSHDRYKTKPLNGVDLIVCAASTGGPSALETLSTKISSKVNVPFLIVQHMPPNFTTMLARAMDKKSALRVVEAHEGMKLKKGQIALAPGGYHMTVNSSDNGEGIICINEDPLVNGVRPSADVLFESVANIYGGKRILSIILTGMGNDGMRGVKLMKERCICYCITQSEESCVVYGMPKSVYMEGLSDESLDIGKIATRIEQIAGVL